MEAEKQIAGVLRFVRREISKAKDLPERLRFRAEELEWVLTCIDPDAEPDWDDADPDDEPATDREYLGKTVRQMRDISTSLLRHTIHILELIEVAEAAKSLPVVIPALKKAKVEDQAVAAE